MSIEIGSAKDKTGKVIDLFWDENVPKKNRGVFITHQISARIGKDKCGYLSIGYIPRENLPIFLPTVFHYLSEFGGSYFPYLFEGFHGKAVTEISNDDFKKLIATVVPKFFAGNLDFSDVTTLEQLENKLQKKRRFKELVGRFEEFKKFHVDRPLVNFINTRHSFHNEIHNDYTYRGIGTILYSAGAHELRKRNFFLHASGIQSDEAALVWEKFESRGWVLHDEDRRFLNPEKVPNVIVDEVVPA